MEALSFQFISLMAEALGLPSDAFDPFFDQGEGKMQHRAKAIIFADSLEYESSLTIDDREIGR